MVARKNLQRFFPTSQFGVTREVVPLTMGLSGAAVYSATTDAGVFVLRIHGQDRDSWKKIILAQEIASRHRIAPAIVHTDHTEYSGTSKAKDLVLPSGLFR